MFIGDVDTLCEELEKAESDLNKKRAELEELQLRIEKETEEIKLLREIADIRGEEFKEEVETEKKEEIKKGVKNIKLQIDKKRKEIYKGLGQIYFDIPKQIPEIDSYTSILNFEGGPYNFLQKFLLSMINTENLFEIDNTQLFPDRIVIKNVTKPKEVIMKLKIFRNNLGRLAKIALGEKDEDIENVVEYLHNSTYRDIWESIGGQDKVSNQELYSKFGFSDSKDKMKIRNFFTVLKNTFKEKPLFVRTQTGIHEITFFGKLVWKRYEKTISSKIAEKKEIETRKDTEIRVKEAEPTQSLNKFLNDDDIRKVLYGV